MNSTGLDVFDKTVQESNLWLKRLMALMETDSRHAAYATLKAVLHALRDRIGPENAVHLGAQLPMLLRGVYYDGWRMAGTPTKERHKEAFLDRVRIGLPASLDADAATRAVFGVIWEKIDPNEVSKVIAMFPEELRELWPITLERQEAG